MKIIVRRNIWFIFSGLLILISILALSFWGLKLSIEFTGGIIDEVNFPQKIEASSVKDALADQNLPNLQVTQSGERGVIIKVNSIPDQQVQNLKTAISTKLPGSTEVRMESVGPTVSKNLTKKAIISVILACLAIVLYLAFTFRKVPKPVSSWRFGVCAVIALFHDIIITLGAFSIFGHFWGYEVDSLFIVALLTILGFSVHDTIVVFDRIRENLRRQPNEDFEQIVGNSISQTLVRSLNTSMTVLLVLSALTLLGGKSIVHFVAILLVGITIGTYSSIFNASPLLVVWQNLIVKKQQRMSHTT